MPVFSLPSPYGIGSFGKAAYEFIDFLYAAGQRYWQVLPLSPTSYGDSPYQSFSSFAGNPYFIDLDTLHEEGLIAYEDYAECEWGRDPEAIDYGLLYEKRFEILFKACHNFDRGNADFVGFCEMNQYWLEEYALFMALKEKFGGKSWVEWESAYKCRDHELLNQARASLAETIENWKVLQYFFFSQWFKLKDYANQKGILIIGDIPIYVAMDSVDVWSNPSEFRLNENHDPIFIAGVPPDAFTKDGQLWGNPLYDWDAMRQNGYAWWLKRVAHVDAIYDLTRIDHFRGFDSYYAIPFGEETARMGQWEQGPGIDFFHTLEKELGKLPLIAEDLGFLTPSVYRLVEETGFPNMKVLQFAFDIHHDSDYLPHNYHQNCVVYTGTHDNDTIRSWFSSAPPEETEYAIQYMRLTQEETYHWGMIKTAWGSPADTAIVPMQDLLGLAGYARTNYPSTLGTNWKWRMLPGKLSRELSGKLWDITQIYRRLPK